MEFYLVDVHSTVTVNGEDVAFDYINTYQNEKIANKEAHDIALNDDVLKVSVHRWTLQKDGSHEIDEEYSGFYYLNRNHREFRSDKEVSD